MLEKYADTIALPYIIFFKSLLKQELPQHWKLANDNPIFKMKAKVCKPIMKALCKVLENSAEDNLLELSD